MSQNEIKHYGVKGMRWGTKKGNAYNDEMKRKGKSIPFGSLGASIGNNVNLVKHPILTSKALGKVLKKRKLLAFTRRNAAEKEIYLETKKLINDKKKNKIGIMDRTIKEGISKRNVAIKKLKDKKEIVRLKNLNIKAAKRLKNKKLLKNVAKVAAIASPVVAANTDIVPNTISKARNIYRYKNPNVSTRKRRY